MLEMSALQSAPPAARRAHRQAGTERVFADLFRYFPRALALFPVATPMALRTIASDRPLLERLSAVEGELPAGLLGDIETGKKLIVDSLPNGGYGLRGTNHEEALLYASMRAACNGYLTEDLIAFLGRFGLSFSTEIPLDGKEAEKLKGAASLLKGMKEEYGITRIEVYDDEGDIMAPVTLATPIDKVDFTLFLPRCVFANSRSLANALSLHGYDFEAGDCATDRID